MTLRGEAVAAEVVSMGRLYWTLGLGKTRGKIGANMATGLGILLGCAAAAYAGVGKAWIVWKSLSAAAVSLAGLRGRSKMNK